MDYYIRGNEKRADEIKDAFERLGIDTNHYSIGNDYYLYYSSNGLLYFDDFSDTLLNVFKSHPGYKELELSVEPMFKVGDWLYHNKVGVYPILITGYDENLGYQTECLSTRTYFRQEFVEKEYHLWSIEDAKDGDVLAADECYVIFKEVDGLNIKCYCTYHYMGFNPSFHIDTLQNKAAFNPATKEQRELLFKKMEEAGYTWDDKKKGLKKIPKHYDIASFHAGMPVLVRDSNDQEWNYLLFSHYRKKMPDHFFAGGYPWFECIPFSEETKHLLGTTDMCDEQYVNW